MAGSKKPNAGSKNKRARIKRLNPRGDKKGGKRTKNKRNVKGNWLFGMFKKR